MLPTISDFSLEAQIELLDGIEQVLDNRMHKRKVMGEDVLVKGSLSKALRIPEIRRKLASRNSTRQHKGTLALAELWATLSPVTQQSVLALISWYDPSTLEWDDPRSNRRPQSS